ncbi:hypothetical protein AAVH_28194 [Aphelenchoides avenae]|nr:hypothetical protein AAVH_28194 [Aphelenchus avenae]
MVATIAYCSNTLLFYLVLFHTPRELRVYSRVLRFDCIVDYIFITSNFVLEPHITIHGGTFFFVFNSFVKSTSPDVSFAFALLNQVMSNWLLVTLICSLSGMSVPVSCYFIFYPALWGWLRTDRRLFDSLPCVFNARVPFFSMEAVGPILLIVVPLIMTLVVTYERKQEAPELMLVSTMLSWITLLNPLSTIYFVKACRYKAMGLVFRRRNLVQPSPTFDHRLRVD